MRFREIRTSEKITDRFVEENKVENFKQIKSETDITVEECNKFWDNVFKK